MSETSGWFKRFAENFGKVPDEPPTPLIPQRLRMPVFLGMALVSLVLLVLLLWLVVLPAIRAQQSAPSHAESPTPAVHAAVRA